MTTFNWLSLFGVPAIILAIFTAIYGKLKARIAKTNEENEALKRGMKVLLMDRMYELYSVSKKNGGATKFQRQNWNILYVQYHNLGGNGDMNDVRDKFFDLPILDE